MTPDPETFRAAFPLTGLTDRNLPTRFVDPLSDAELAELNRLLPWRCFTADGRGRRFGNPTREGKRDKPQEIPDRRIVLMDQRFGLAGAHVLEIGCFEGVHTLGLCRFAARVTAVDSRIENVVKTIVRCALFGAAPTVFRCDIEERPLDEEALRADYVHHVGVLYHLADPVRHLRDLGRLARRGIMLDTHYCEASEATESYDVDGRSFRFKGYRELGREDVFSGMSPRSRWLPLDTIVELLREQGFTQVDVVETHASRNGPRALVMASRASSADGDAPAAREDGKAAAAARLAPVAPPAPAAPSPRVAPSAAASPAERRAPAASDDARRDASGRHETRDLARRLAATENDLAKTTKVIKALARRHYGALPLPPEELRLHVGKSTSAANYWAQGMSSSTRLLEVFGEDPGKPILDWGCGSGRTLRWLLAYEGWRRHWHGCDVDRAAIEWLRSAGSFAAEVCADDPPLPYRDGTFGGLYAFSVLTHIHPSRHCAWYAELRRVLQPGGVAYLTTLGASTLTDTRKEVHGAAIADAFARDGFVYLRNEGHYKDGAVVSESFTRRALDGLFTVDHYTERGYGVMDAFLLRAY